VSEGAVVVAFKRSHNEKKEAGTVVEDHRRVKPDGHLVRFPIGRHESVIYFRKACLVHRQVAWLAQALSDHENPLVAFCCVFGLWH